MSDDRSFYRQTTLARLGFHWSAAEACWQKFRIQVSEDRLHSMEPWEFDKLVLRYTPRRD